MDSEAAEPRCAAAPTSAALVHVVTWDEPKLVAALRLDGADHDQVRVTALPTLQAIIEVALARQPDVVIIPAGVVTPQAERAIVRGLRTRLPPTRVLLAVPLQRLAVDQDLTLFDGLISLHDPGPDLLLALAPLLQRPARRAPREPVSITAELTLEHGGTVDAMAVNVSDGGAAFLLAPGAVADHVRSVRFCRADGRSVTVETEVVWSRVSPGHGDRLGVRFVSASLTALRALRDLALWRVVSEPDGDVLHLSGVLSDATCFAALLLAVARTPRLDLAAVATATAPGLLRWYDFLLDLPPGVELRLRRVSAPLAEWLTMLPAMTHRCIIESAHVTYVCGGCSLEVESLRTSADPAPPGPCPSCTGELRATRRWAAPMRLRREA